MPTARDLLGSPALYLTAYLATARDQRRALMALGRWLDQLREMVQRKLQGMG